jgi:hypothetical protein
MDLKLPIRSGHITFFPVICLLTSRESFSVSDYLERTTGRFLPSPWMFLAL